MLNEFFSEKPNDSWCRHSSKNIKNSAGLDSSNQQLANEDCELTLVHERS